MKLKKKLLRLGQVLWRPFIAFLILLLCGIIVANAKTPQQIAKKALAATVLLVMEDANGKLLGLGSGFFVDTNLIATNFHVIDGAARGTAKLVGEQTEYPIEVFTAMDETHDLAILQVAAPDIQPLPLGDSDTVEIGDTVYVAGNPKGFLEGTFSDGIISAVRGGSTNKWFQMTAPISSGSSGGPVLNSSGEVIGVSVATFRDGQNLNFAIPSNYLKKLLPQLGHVRPLLKRQQPSPSELSSDKSPLANHDTAIRLNPNDAEAYLNRGVAKGKLGQYFAAIIDYDTAIRLNPDSTEAYFRRGNAKALLGQYFAAIIDYDTAIRLNPNDAKAYIGRGLAKEGLGQHFAAITDFDTAIRLNPDDARTYAGRGNAKALLGQYDAAITDFDTAIRLNPDLVEAYVRRGLVRVKLGQHFAAITDFDTAIRFNPDDARAYAGRGVAKHKLGRPREGRRDFQTALKLAERAGDPRLKTQIESAIRDSR